MWSIEGDECRGLRWGSAEGGRWEVQVELLLRGEEEVVLQVRQIEGRLELDFAVVGVWEGVRVVKGGFEVHFAVQNCEVVLGGGVGYRWCGRWS